MELLIYTSFLSSRFLSPKTNFFKESYKGPISLYKIDMVLFHPPQMYKNAH